MLINSSLDEKIAGSGANGVKAKTKSNDKSQDIIKKAQIETKDGPLIAIKRPEGPGTGELS
jgi:hypothetical protein